jgi:hypothetical protein
MNTGHPRISLMTADDILILGNGSFITKTNSPLADDGLATSAWIAAHLASAPTQHVREPITVPSSHEVARGNRRIDLEWRNLYRRPLLKHARRFMVATQSVSHMCRLCMYLNSFDSGYTYRYRHRYMRTKNSLLHMKRETNASCLLIFNIYMELVCG